MASLLVPVLNAAGRRVPDLIGPGLRVIFCGINPGLYSAATRHHFARPGNRFWPALHAGGFTPRILAPWEERELLELGLGITNLVARATASAAGLWLLPNPSGLNAHHQLRDLAVAFADLRRAARQPLLPRSPRAG